MKQVRKSIFTFQSIQSITRRALSRAYTSAKVQQSTLTTNDGQDIRYPPLHGMTKLSPNRNTVLPGNNNPSIHSFGSDEVHKYAETRSSADADNGLDAFSGQSIEVNKHGTILGPLRLFAKHVIVGTYR